MNAIELSKEQYIQLKMKNDVRKWLMNTSFTNFTTDDCELVSEIVCHYLSGKNTVLQFQDRNSFCLRNISYFAMIFIGMNHICDFRFVTDGKPSKKYNSFASLMKNTNIQCNAEFVSYDDFMKNPVLDKYTIIDHPSVDGELMNVLFRISWNSGLLLLR